MRCQGRWSTLENMSDSRKKQGNGVQLEGKKGNRPKVTRLSCFFRFVLDTTSIKKVVSVPALDVDCDFVVSLSWSEP